MHAPTAPAASSSVACGSTTNVNDGLSAVEDEPWTPEKQRDSEIHVSRIDRRNQRARPLGWLFVSASLSIVGCSDDGDGAFGVDASGGTDVGAHDVQDTGMASDRATDGDTSAGNDALESGADVGDATGDSAGDANADASREGGADSSDGPRESGSDARLDSGSDVFREASVPPDGGPVNGPGCGGCFSDELPTNGRCATNTSCGSPPHAVMLRVDGQCQIYACHPGWADCDGKANTGCEVDVTKTDNCGRCGVQCAANELCGATGCTGSCAAPTTMCGDTCADLSSSPEHCGTCEPCPARQWHRPTCTGGVCGFEKICPPGTDSCGDGCNLLDEDPDNCGRCGRACSPPSGGTVSCELGVCVPHCPQGFSVCNGACVDLQTDPAHCRTCGNACTTGGCVAGTCDASWSPVVTTGTAPTALTIDATSLYWLETQAGKVMKAPKGGGTAIALAMNQASPVDLALDASHVYWANRAGGAIMRAPKAGGSAPEVVVMAREPIALTTDGEFVFFGEAIPPDAGLGRPILRRTRIGSGTGEDYWTFPTGDTDATLVRLLVDDLNVYWGGRRNTVIQGGVTFQIYKETGLDNRTLPGIWAELAIDQTSIYMTAGSGKPGIPMSIAAIRTSDGRGSGILQFQPGGTYTGGGYMAAGDTYLYRSSSGQFAGLYKVLKCGTDNAPIQITTDRWSYLVADSTYVYGVWGAEIRRAHR